MPDISVMGQSATEYYSAMLTLTPHVPILSLELGRLVGLRSAHIAGAHIWDYFQRCEAY